MIYTENKPMDEILASLGQERNVFLLACNGCAEVCETGGARALSQIHTELEKAGKNVTGSVLVDFLCNKLLVASRLATEQEKLRQADSVLALTCGVGVQAVSRVVDKAVHPGANTVSLGGLQGLWPSDERCEACGDCALDYTGGICPITSCTKGLLNGPCGGAKDGKCEIDPEKDCGWVKIYERLRETDRLGELEKIRGPRDHSKMLPTADLRKTSFYDLEK